MNNKILICIFIQLIYLFVCSEAIIVTKSFKVRTYVREFERFGFADGGTVNLKGRLLRFFVLKLLATSEPSFEDSPSRIFICSNDDFTRVVNEVDTGSNTEVKWNENLCNFSVL